MTLEGILILEAPDSVTEEQVESFGEQLNEQLEACGHEEITPLVVSGVRAGTADLLTEDALDELADKIVERLEDGSSRG